MCEWMLQNTLTMPAFGKTCMAVLPVGYRPRLKLAALESEKTLWKNGSALGNATVDPRVIASTCGTNDS